MNSIHADGGWALALTLTILFVAFAFITVRKRWPSMIRKPGLAYAEGSSTDDSKQKPGKEPEKKGHGSGHGTKRSPILLYLLIGVIAIVIVINIIPITGWVVDTFLHEVLGDRIVQPTAVVTKPRVSIGISETVIRKQVLAERKRVEEERFVLPLMYGERHHWIHVPGGGFLTHFTVDDQKVIGVQCSSSIEEPSIDASGTDYECNDGITANWVRFYVWNAEEGPVTVRYHFEYAF